MNRPYKVSQNRTWEHNTISGRGPFDVKSLPVELDNLKKCEEEIEILTSERDKKIADKQEEIERIGYDPKRLAILTACLYGWQ